MKARLVRGAIQGEMWVMKHQSITSLLSHAVEAHGSLECWHELDKVASTLSITGELRRRRPDGSTRAGRP
ncbi:hypothetical protein C7I55_03605 [Sphingomonas deserti]|uniref:Uncharacterized protein n=1 Tax=Allosphingosinicella deserti TaxID=2116704 RepID=A0A2P7QZS6_9SPHN|nr:hypothetical protein C7I55_03605 [Sphingomonas deserti]